MRALITGGAGFIGSEIAQLLTHAGHQVAILDDLSGGYRRNVPSGAHLTVGSVTDAAIVDATFRQHRPEMVFHAAAYAAEGLSHWMRRFCYSENLVGWANLANAIAEHDVRRVIICSSMAVYGSQQAPFDEDMVPEPIDPYGIGKAAVEADVRALSAIHGTEWIVVRPHNVYGPRQNLADPYRNVVAIFMRQALAQEPISVFGDGEQKRAFSYVGDVASAIVAIAMADSHKHVVNIGGDAPVSILDLATMIKGATRSKSEIVHLPTRPEVRDAWCRHNALRRLLGSWAPTPLDEGLRSMVSWAKTIQIGPMRRYTYESKKRLYAPWEALTGNPASQPNE